MYSRTDVCFSLFWGIALLVIAYFLDIDVVASVGTFFISVALALIIGFMLVAIHILLFGKADLTHLPR